MPGIGIISNPRSRQNVRKPARMERLAYILGQEGAAQATSSLESLARAAEHFKKERIDILAINGGDGTNHVTLTTFIKVYGDVPLPKIALLRGGTMNTTANGLGVMRASPSKILTNLVERYAAGETFQTAEHHILKVGDEYGFIFGNGVIYNFLDIYYGSGGRPMARHKVIDQLVRRLEIYASGPIEYTIDGDTFTAGEKLVIECGPLLTLIQR